LRPCTSGLRGRASFGVDETFKAAGLGAGRLMAVFRLVFGLLLASGVVCFAVYIGTGQIEWRRRGLMIIKWTVLVAFAFFAVLILERVAVLL
jgi:hypothetical protein